VIPRHAPEMDVWELDGELVIWHAGSVHRLGGAAVLLWQAVDARTPLEELYRRLAGAHGLSVAAVATDLGPVVARLVDDGLLVDEES
jgi:hypothetical protein